MDDDTTLTSANDLRHGLSRDKRVRASSGSFADLQVLSTNLAIRGNDAEALRDWPEYSLLALRGWLVYLLDFLEAKHSIPEYVGQGELENRIDRLPHHGVKIKDALKEVLDDVRIYSNKAAHPVRNERFFTVKYADEALDKARRIRDWLRQQYIRPATQTERTTQITPRAPEGDIESKSTVQKGAFPSESQFSPTKQAGIPKIPNERVIVRASFWRRHARTIHFLTGLFDFLIVIVAIAVLNIGRHDHEKASNITMQPTPAASHTLNTPETTPPPIPTNPATAPRAPSRPNKRALRAQ
jgi:hypothetical protein